MNDLIRREDAVKEMALMLEDISADLCEDILTRFGYDTPQELATEAMSIIPSAERKGEWIYCEDDEGQDGYRCSECGFFVPWYYDYEDSNYILDYKACPHCLARMKGAEDEMLR